MVCFTPVGKVVVHGELSHPANMLRIYFFFFGLLERKGLCLLTPGLFTFCVRFRGYVGQRRKAVSKARWSHLETEGIPRGFQ